MEKPDLHSLNQEFNPFMLFLKMIGKKSNNKKKWFDVSCIQQIQSLLYNHYYLDTRINLYQNSFLFFYN